jgi:hypothetical protein
MSRPQFHSIRLFILRHAWLNLSDKHMTTGRINQVTILIKITQKKDIFFKLKIFFLVFFFFIKKIIFLLYYQIKIKLYLFLLI